MTHANTVDRCDIVFTPAHTRWLSHRHIPHMFTTSFVQVIFKHQKEQGQKGRPDDVLYVLARTIRSNLQYQAAAGIGAMGAQCMAVRGKGIKRVMQILVIFRVIERSFRGTQAGR